MKELYVVRHAKSSWSNPQQTDFERPLNTRGKQDAMLMSEKLTEYHISPQMVLCSNAKRTRKTLQYLQKQMQLSENNIELKNELYAASKEQLVYEVSKIPDEIEKAMVVAHNPGVTNFTNYLLGSDRVNFPTLGIACLTLHMDSWKELSGGIATLQCFIYPKMFRYR